MKTVEPDGQAYIKYVIRISSKRSAHFSLDYFIFGVVVDGLFVSETLLYRYLGTETISMVTC